ncbi:hypothetical protein MAA_09890 [Metarhizium robertsii ARSEF 23]|uniref:Uncharacterized protein n=1 Tax=Metarhizium robertsii (strain ARSEF 23 / ATCC MYA-3075) TaxID=655844 RepID=E9FC91_METRA|nr:uncharacterized protein MAA_09890 [Metarhizium robertsii ARSEF 23]EFY94669.2 hypothetical protein MAA_09890 [Metarhizium robertsii ARSEF 23]
MNEMFAGLSIERAKAARRSASVAYEDVDFDIDDDENGQEAAPDEQTTAGKRRRLTDAEILENEIFMPEKQEDLAYVSGLIGGKPKKLTGYTVNFYLKDIEPMVCNDKAYEHLVYDPQQKDLVLSFVESHGRASTLDGRERVNGSDDDNGGL